VGEIVGVIGAGEGVNVGVDDGPGVPGVEVCVSVGMGDTPGVGDIVGNGVSTGVVGFGPGVGVDVAIIFRLPGTKSMAVRVFVPWETRALHSTAV
jgi:hypothetical protein